MSSSSSSSPYSSTASSFSSVSSSSSPPPPPSPPSPFLLLILLLSLPILLLQIFVFLILIFFPFFFYIIMILHCCCLFFVFIFFFLFVLYLDSVSNNISDAKKTFIKPRPENFIEWRFFKTKKGGGIFWTTLYFSLHTDDRLNGLWSDEGSLRDNYLYPDSYWENDECTGCTCDDGAGVVTSCTGSTVYVYLYST